MFHRVLGVVAVALFAVLVAGCGGSKTRAPVNQSDVPDFVLNPVKAKGVLYGTGIAEQQSMQLAKETADLRARKEIATILSSKVTSLLNDFLRSSGVGTEAEATELSESVTRSITEGELVGATIERREYVKGKMYSLAKYPLDNSMKELISKIVNNSLTSRSALLSEFRAKQGFEELDRRLEKLKESEAQ
jgi:PBP1b-binding outer membrane lipoprotein LpoB